MTIRLSLTRIECLIGRFFLLGALGLPGTASAQLPRNEIEVRVTTPDGRAADLMPVILLDDGYTEIAMRYTDAGGRCHFRGLTQGTFYIQLEPKGDEYLRPAPFRVQIGDVVTSGGEKFLFEMRLLPKDRGGREALPSTGTAVFHQQVPPEAKQSYDQGCESLERDDFASAEKSLKHALELFPSYYDALDQLGSAYVRQRDFEQAVPLLKHAVEVNKRGWHALYSLGAALLGLNKREEGIAALKTAAESNPLSPNISMRLGIELSKDSKSYDEAVRALTRASRLAGKDLPDAYLFLASIYSKQNKYREAADSLESYLEAVPKADPEQKAQYRKLIDQLKAKASQSRKKPE